LGTPNLGDDQLYDKAKDEGFFHDKYLSRTNWVIVASALYYIKIFTNFDRHVTDIHEKLEYFIDWSFE